RHSHTFSLAMTCIEDKCERSGLSFIGALLHRRQIFDWKHHALVLISNVKNLRNRRSLLVPLRGFTLAEVLITLGIIGVVAALTIPTLIQKFDERETIVKVKKMYSTLSRAFEHYKIEHPNVKASDFSTPDNGGSTQVFNIFKDYLMITKDCGTGDGTLCSTPSSVYLLNSPSVYNNYSGNQYLHKVLLNDGSSILFSGFEGNEMVGIVYDINGNKSKNVYGKDLFSFAIDLEGNLLPRGLENGTNYVDSDCLRENSEGVACTSWIIYNENMDYLHCDDLSWNGKTKCD
ncbi:prepilin-type N-terminal cleavage/methylation domain-containing protein, partial [bacterium]|nr:prepilin-type N-terminal cleavage/methylation domain-containing protein [bacterium]